MGFGYRVYHDSFYEIALENLSLAEDIIDKEDRTKPIYKENPELAERLLGESIEKYTLISLMFSALTAEAFINYYAVYTFGEKYFKDHIDKLDLLSKWVIIPQLALKKDFLIEGVHLKGELRKLIN